MQNAMLKQGIICILLLFQLTTNALGIFLTRQFMCKDGYCYLSLDIHTTSACDFIYVLFLVLMGLTGFTDTFLKMFSTMDRTSVMLENAFHYLIVACNAVGVCVVASHIIQNDHHMYSTQIVLAILPAVNIMLSIASHLMFMTCIFHNGLYELS